MAQDGKYYYRRITACTRHCVKPTQNPLPRPNKTDTQISNKARRQGEGSLNLPSLHEHCRATRSDQLLLPEMPIKLQRSRSCHELPTKTDHEENHGNLLSEAERCYYGYINGKFTQHEFLIYARNLRRLDPESYDYLKWLGARWIWVFVQGDVLKPDVEKWKRVRLFRIRNKLKELLL